jgi:hypothetical protein
MRFDVTMDMTGPIFKAGGPNLDREINGAVKELVQMGEERLAQTLRPRPSPGVYLTISEAGKNASTGHYRRSISTTFKNLGAIISDGGVVYGPWLEGISSRNKTSRFPGYASFRRTGQWLEAKAEDVFGAYIQRFVRRMNA